MAMSDGKKYLRRTDIGLVLAIEPALLELLRPFLDKAGFPYEVLDAPPESGGSGGSGGEAENQRRRRSS
jgi:hypothetical protein